MPRLFVVPTPIGNLEDITYRAVRILGAVSLILAEDTRHTRKLLSHYGMATPLLSYHQHNKRVRLDGALKALSAGDVALVSSAGTPAVSDPGFELIVSAVQAGIEVEVLPGPSAVVTAVVVAALPAPGFLFAGFLPRRSQDRRRRLAEVAAIPYSVVLYEAPHRLLACLQDIREVLGDRQAVAARELTKLHQEVVRGTVAELIVRYTAETPRGEFTLVVAGASPTAEDRSGEAMEELRCRHLQGEEARTATPAVASKYGISRNQAYRLWLEVVSR